MPGWWSNDDFREELAALLQAAGGASQLEPFWQRIADAANEAAWNDVRAALAGRRFTPTQISGWDRGKEFQRSIGLWRALTEGGATKDWDKAFIDGMDRRAELTGDPAKGVQAVQVTVGGIEQDPYDVSTGVSPIGFGKMVNKDQIWDMETPT